MEHWKEKYNDLLRNYRDRGRKINELQDELNKVRDDLSSAEYKISSELEPRIKSEQKSYDLHVTSPTFGMPEGCNQDCLEHRNLECDGYRDYLNDNNIDVDVIIEIGELIGSVENHYAYTGELDLKIQKANEGQIKYINTIKDTLNNIEQHFDITLKDIVRPMEVKDVVLGKLYFSIEWEFNRIYLTSVIDMEYGCKLEDCVKDLYVINDKYMEIIDEM